MKAALLTLSIGLAAISGANAAQSPSPAQILSSLTVAASLPTFEAAGRTGSHRVGGSGRSGKGGRYVGGRRK